MTRTAMKTRRSKRCPVVPGESRKKAASILRIRSMKQVNHSLAKRQRNQDLRSLTRLKARISLRK